MKKTAFENADGNRFFIMQFTSNHYAPDIVRSALDASEGVNGNLQEKLDDLSLAHFSVMLEVMDRKEAEEATIQMLRDTLEIMGYRELA